MTPSPFVKTLFVARQPNLFERFAFPHFEVPEDYQVIDTVLEDESLILTLAKDFPDALTGRDRTPVEQTLRFMVLKHQKALSYRELEETLTYNLADRWFCKVNEHAPCFKTMHNQLSRVGDATLHEINDRVMEAARKRKLTKGKRMRVDSTITEASIHYPTDSSLLADAMRVLARTVKRSGSGVQRTFRTFTRKIKQQVRIIRTIGRRNVAVQKEAIRKALSMGRTMARQAKDIIGSEVAKQRVLLERVVQQTTAVLSGQKVKERIVSIFDLSARPLKKGKAGKSCEFGQEVQIQEDERFITNWQMNSKPSDTRFFTEALEKHEELYGKAPNEVAVDRGYWSPENEKRAIEAGVAHVSVPKKGKRTDAEKKKEGSRTFRALQRWRAGGEAKISWWKRKYGGRRSAYKGREGMARWVGAGIVACNLVVFARAVVGGG